MYVPIALTIANTICSPQVELHTYYVDLRDYGPVDILSRRDRDLDLLSFFHSQHMPNW